MRISEMLTAIANWLEDPNNEAIMLAEYDDNCLNVVADSCVKAASELRKAAQTVDSIEPPEETNINSESISELADVAYAFDKSEDPGLKRMASVIDELLLTIASPPNYMAEKKAAEDRKTDILKEKYFHPQEKLKELNKASEAEKAIKDSPVSKEYKILEFGLSSRYCPDHPGAQVARVGEHQWQCSLDKKVYNFDTGFTMANGNKVPGGDVSEQTKLPMNESNNIFDTRESRLGR